MRKTIEFLIMFLILFLVVTTVHDYYKMKSLDDKYGKLYDDIKSIKDMESIKSELYSIKSEFDSLKTNLSFPSDTLFSNKNERINEIVKKLIKIEGKFSIIEQEFKKYDRKGMGVKIDPTIKPESPLDPENVKLEKKIEEKP